MSSLELCMATLNPSVPLQLFEYSFERNFEPWMLHATKLNIHIVRSKRIVLLVDRVSSLTQEEKATSREGGPSPWPPSSI
jgi:hypothetical protein